MRVDIVSLFPDMFSGPFGQSMIKRATEKGLLDIHLTNPRDFTYDKHHMVDDYPFGGGEGMVLKPEPMFRAVEQIKQQSGGQNCRVLLMCPSGQTFTQKKAIELAAGYEQLIFVCGHYEGFDARIKEHLIDETVSIGDYVLTGGELPAMVIVDAIARMIPGVLGTQASAETDSFYQGLLGYPQYTRPRDFQGMMVPDLLISGDHGKIAQWRRKEALRNTWQNRPDLLGKADLDLNDKKILAEIEAEVGGK